MLLDPRIRKYHSRNKQYRIGVRDRNVTLYDRFQKGPIEASGPKGVIARRYPGSGNNMPGEGFFLDHPRFQKESPR